MKARFHLTRPLATYSVLLIIVVLVAMHTQYNFLFWLMGLMFGLLVVSMTLTWLMIRASDVHRADPAYGAVGTPLTVRYILRNRARRLPLLNMNLSERPARQSSSGLPW